MTTFSNERKIATVQGGSDGIDISGEFQIDSDNRIISFSGRVSGQDGDGFSGYFNLCEKADGKISFAIDDVSAAWRISAGNLVFAIAADIHAEYDIEGE